ncbi:AP-4 complex subunit epsilon-1 [Mortierella claussenii]|nr:AP-4 complex subunit epsilon-1 [Mortierella claussenii]
MTLPDVIPSMVSHVLTAMSHANESVRKRALIALKNFYVQDSSLIAPYLDQIKRALYDSEPSVMSAALGLFVVVVQEHAREMVDLVPVLVRILQQVVDGKLPKGYSYHGTSAPWIQIRCLQIMACLGQRDLSASKAMTPVVMGAFHKARQGVDAAFAIVFEAIRTLNTFHPAIILELCHSKDIGGNPLLIISKFATSSNQNLKYLGISMLCQVRPNAWSDAWWSDDLLSAVVEALDSRDTTIQRRALDLLYKMLTIDNSENIIDRLVHAFYQEQDEELADGQDRHSLFRYGEGDRHNTTPSRKEKILHQILEAAETFGKSEEWYLDLMFDLLKRGGQVVTIQIVEKIIQVFEQGAKCPAFNTIHLRVLAVRKSMQMLSDNDYNLSAQAGGIETPPLAVAYFVLWLLGEYGDNADDWTIITIFETLARCLLINRALVLTALTKVALKSPACGVPKNIVAVVREQILCQPKSSQSLYHLDAQQRAQEFIMIAKVVSLV